MRMMKQSIAAFSLGVFAWFLLGAGATYSVGTTATTVFDGTNSPVTGIASVQIGSPSGSNDEVDITVEYDGPPAGTDTKTIKPGDPLYKSYVKIKKITAKKKGTGTATVPVVVDVTPTNGTVAVASSWRTTATEEAIPLSRSAPAVIVFGITADSGSISTIALMNGSTVVAERTIDSSNGWAGSFSGTSIVVRANSGTGSLTYSTVE